MEAEAPVLDPQLLAVIAEASLPDAMWQHGDDLCDCTFQRIGLWTNPYIARTLKVRFCCIWEELYKQYPQHVQRIPAFLDYNNSAEGENGHETYELLPREWDGEGQMPRALWHRQIQTRTGQTLAEIREEYTEQTPPQPRLPEGFWLPSARS